MSPVTLQSDWGEDKALVLPFSAARSIIHLLVSPRNRRLTSLFPPFLEAQSIFGSWAEVLSSARAWVCGGEMLGGKGCLVTI